jgi:hypothetical protein
VALLLRPVITTNAGVVTTNFAPNDYAAVTQGQLKQFTARAVDELNANLSGGAGTNLNSMMSNWAADYATNGYGSTNIKPSDYTAMNVGQVKYIGNKIWSRLVSGGYTNAIPSWLGQSTNTDNALANLGQLKSVFNFSLTTSLPDTWQIEYFGHTGNDPSSSPDGNGLTLLQDYEQGNDPTNYYSQNGGIVVPVMTIISGNNQTVSAGTFAGTPLVIYIANGTGTTLVNAPVTFTLASGSDGSFALTSGGTTSFSLSLTTDVNGNATVTTRLVPSHSRII